MDRKTLITDLKKILLDKPDSVDEYNIKYHWFCEDEIENFIELLEKLKD